MSTYSHPESLVETSWLAEHLDDPGIRIIESNEDILLYGMGHLKNAAHVDWKADLNDPRVRDFINSQQFAALASRLGITPETTVVFYGDKGNWWAAYALWIFRLFGHERVKILNGGRDKWIGEGRPLTREITDYKPSTYPAPRDRQDSLIRAFKRDALHQSAKDGILIDVRSPQEFRGEVMHMPEYPQEGVLRGGHIPGAKNVPWKRAVREDGTFKPVEELRKIYLEEVGLAPEKEVLVYCRIGERSSHTWFVLSYLLGFKDVRNYDGSWTEWGNAVRTPIETGD
jgi:thiosulfate/3-mercaptopyruvate sulfurtransferase